MDIKIVENIIGLIKKFNLSEITVTEKVCSNFMRKVKETSIHIAQITTSTDTNVKHQESEKNNYITQNNNVNNVKKERKSEHKNKIVKSFMVGTFYRASSPNSEPFVKEGQTVNKGDVLCIVESMKTMNQIESEYSGIIKKVCIENGNPVEFNQPMFVIE